MNLEQEEFYRLYCRWVPGEKGKSKLSLKEKYNYDCIFWKSGEGCSVYESRPLQCRAFPFWASVLEGEESWKAMAEECPGMNSGCLHTPDSIKEWLAIQKNEPILFRNG
jgi:Fe-S-cluster containining protein